MAFNSSNSNYDNALAAANNLSTTLSPRSGSKVPMNRVCLGQLGLNQRMRMELRKTMNKSATSLDDGDTQIIMRRSQLIRAQLVHAASLLTTSNEVVRDTEEKNKAREMLQAQLLRASAAPPKNDVVYGMRGQLYAASRVISSLKSCPSFGNEISESDNNALISIVEPTNRVEVISDEELEGSQYDGRIHSFPYRKNGPYTCPKCRHVFDTSQRFAAHVSSSHYKYETKGQRKKRLMAKIRGRSLRLERINDGITVTSSERNNNAEGVTVTMKVEAAEGVKIKSEPVDT